MGDKLDKMAKQLAYWREKRGYSLKRLADKANVSKNCIYNYESVALPSSIANLLAICEALDITLNDLFPPEENDQHPLEEYIHTLNHSEKDKLGKAIREIGAIAKKTSPINL